MSKRRVYMSNKITPTVFYRTLNVEGLEIFYREAGSRDAPTVPLRANISETSLVPLINEQGEKEKGRDEREFSWCCSFPWGFGCRGTERRRAKRAAAECSGSQSGRRSGLNLAAGFRSGCQAEATDLHG